jgi:aspartate ammonia-lyase
MPGKVNPVIPEFVVSAAHKIYSNDALITHLSAMGTLELNAYLPSIGHAFIDSLNLLIASNQTLAHNLLDGIEVNEEVAAKNLYMSPSVCTALLPLIGYHKATLLAKTMRENHCTIFQANQLNPVIEDQKLNQFVEPGMLLQKGFSIKDL